MLYGEQFMEDRLQLYQRLKGRIETIEFVEEVRPSQRNFAEEERYVNRQQFETARIAGRKLWRLDSKTEIELDKVHGKKSKLDLDLRIPPRVRPQHTVTQVPGRTEATEGISSNVDVCELAKHHTELFW